MDQKLYEFILLFEKHKIFYDKYKNIFYNIIKKYIDNDITGILLILGRWKYRNLKGNWNYLSDIDDNSMKKILIELEQEIFKLI